MSTAALVTPQVVDMQRRQDHRFFDPRTPGQPEDLFGVETDAILRLGRAVTALGVLPPKVNLGLYALPDAVRLVPLIEDMQSGASLTPEHIRPYRKPIKKLSMEVSFADKAAAISGALGVGIPLRRALNRRIEEEFPVRAAEAIDTAREVVAGLEDKVDYLASFENPKEQFVTEVNELAELVTSNIIDQRDRRVRDNIQIEPETPRGLAGLFTKVVRKFHTFFDIFKRNKPEVNTEITAYDAGAGIEKALGLLTRDRDATERKLPMISKILLSRLPNNISLTKDRLALVAPEMLNLIFSISPNNEKNAEMMDSVNRNPHELRFVTRFKKHYGRYSLESIQRASVTLMPAIRDVLPTEGVKVREIFAQVQDLLRYKQTDTKDSETDDDFEQPVTHKKGVLGRLKSRFKRSAHV